jgi:ribosomal protein L37AE/L43A
MELEIDERECQDCHKPIPNNYLWYCDECRHKHQGEAPHVKGPTTYK